jgi:hypothetical protein
MGTEPNASQELQDYLRLEFSPTHEDRLAEQLDFGWHRVNVRPKKYKTYPFTAYQYNTSTPIAPSVTTPPIMAAQATSGLPTGTPAVALLLDGTRAMTGNLLMAGASTVDGRDVSVDGTKLDGIEALADVTDEANVRAALAALTANADFNAKRITNVAGRQATFPWGWAASNSAAVRYMTGPDSAIPGIGGGRRGIPMDRAGSVIAIGINMDVDAYTNGTAGGAVYKDAGAGGVQLVNETFTPSGVADGQFTYGSYAVGTYTFAAGDTLYAARTLSGVATTTRAHMYFTVEFDT